MGEAAKKEKKKEWLFDVGQNESVGVGVFVVCVCETGSIRLVFLCMFCLHTEDRTGSVAKIRASRFSNDCFYHCCGDDVNEGKDGHEWSFSRRKVWPIAS